MKKTIVSTLAVISLLLLSSCATTGKLSQSGSERVSLFGPHSKKHSKKGTTAKGASTGKSRPSNISYRGFQRKPLTPLQEKLVEGAYRLVGTKDRIVVRGRRFNFDCTGTVLAIYYYAGIDLSRDFSRYTGNGVLRLYKMLYERKLLYLTNYPVPGDLIFWDNTYDRNGDGKWNDYLTHVGMVVGVKSDGTIQYVHDHIRKGIIIERMNLLHPDEYARTRFGKRIIVNAPMRMKVAGVRHPSKWLASQLVRAFGKAYQY